jgi:hypothetical protein
VRLDGVQRGKHPHHGLLARGRVGRQQAGFLAAEVQQDGARFEDGKVAVVQHGDLAERLLRAVAGCVLVIAADGAHLVGKARFFQRPAHAQLAHVANGKRWYFVEGSQCVHCRSPWLVGYVARIL